MNTRVLIVEDEFFIAQTLTWQVEDMGCEVCGVAMTADEAVSLALHHEPAVILMDVRLLGKRDGVDAGNAIYGRFDVKIIYVTGSQEPATVERINSDHPFAILFKPFQFKMLEDTIREAMAA
jgi:response regulator of citrate/malate metabolism